jgi:hypothetical protein
MRNLQLTDSYTLYGLNEEEYKDADFHISKQETATGDEADLNNNMFRTQFKFEMSSIVGDGVFSEGSRSIPSKVATTIVESISVGDKKVFKCFVNKQWHVPSAAGILIHEDVHSALNCAINALGKPYAFIITKKDFIK